MSRNYYEALLIAFTPIVKTMVCVKIIQYDEKRYQFAEFSAVSK